MYANQVLWIDCVMANLRNMFIKLSVNVAKCKIFLSHKEKFLKKVVVRDILFCTHCEYIINCIYKLILSEIILHVNNVC